MNRNQRCLLVLKEIYGNADFFYVSLKREF